MRTRDQIVLVVLYQVMIATFVSASFVLIQKTADAQPTASERISGSWEAIPGTYGGARGGTDQDEFLNFARIQRTGNTVNSKRLQLTLDGINRLQQIAKQVKGVFFDEDGLMQWVVVHYPKYWSPVSKSKFDWMI